MKEKKKSKDNIITLNNFKKTKKDNSNYEVKSEAPFDGDPMKRFEFLKENFTEVKEIIIKKHLKENNIPLNKLIIDFKFKPYRDHFDPIMLGGVTYDGYSAHEKEEIFYGVLFNDRIHPSYDDKFYRLLSKFHFYKKKNSKNTKFILILADVPKINFIYKDLSELYLTKRFTKRFEPAIEKNLMVIDIMKFNNSDFNEWYNMIKYN